MEHGTTSRQVSPTAAAVSNTLGAVSNTSRAAAMRHRFSCRSAAWRAHFLWLPCCLLVLLSACGSRSSRFKLEGRLRNMNQGDFYVYSPANVFAGTDTIHVREGRFAYEKDFREPTTLVVIFPNYSEQPVFAEPGATVNVKGDASHLREIDIKGTDTNEDMTKLRMELNRLMPPDVPKAVERFIREHPQSPASIYLLQRHFVLNKQPDYKTAAKLTKLLLKSNPDNGQLIMLNKQLKALQSWKDKKLPTFTATDLKGKKVSLSNLKAKVNVVTVWASWNFQSTDMQRRLKKQKEKYGDKLSVLSICLDGQPSECRRTVVERDSLKWPTVCDGRMWQTPLLAKFGIADVPANLIADSKGAITARNLTPKKLEEKIDELLKEDKKPDKPEDKKPARPDNKKNKKTKI